MGPRSTVVLASALLAGWAIVGCASQRDVATVGIDEPPPAEWAHEAERWAAAVASTPQGQGVIGLIPFFVESVVLDLDSAINVGMNYRGLDQLLAFKSYDYEIPEKMDTSGDVFLDRAGYVQLGSRDAAVVPGETTPLLTPLGIRYEVGAAGIEVEELLAGGTPWQSDPTRELHRIYGDAEAVADRWVELWSRGAPGSLDDAYTAGAVLVDTIAAVDVRGASAIGDRMRLSESTEWRLVELEHAPAVYPAIDPGRHSSVARLSGVLLLVVGDDGGGCPGSQAVWLEVEVESGRILHERRYWSIEDARRCIGEGDLPSGWWTGRQLPESATAPVLEDLDTVTHEVSTEAGTTAIRNGTPTLAALFQWAMSRFDLAGLRPPRIDGVVFTAYDEFCDDFNGRAMALLGGAEVTPEARASAAWDVLLCFDDAAACSGDGCAGFALKARYVMLHELSHVWIAQYVDGPTRELFAARVGLERWRGHDVGWEERAVEWAASYVGWGLMDDEWPMWELGSPPRVQRVDGFQLLTGHQPLRPFDE